MKTTTAALSGITALVVAGSVTGMAGADDHPVSPHRDRIPTATAPVRAPHHVLTATPRAATPQRRHDASHATHPQTSATSLPVLHHHARAAARTATSTRATTPTRATSPTRTVRPRVHHAEPTRHPTSPRRCDDGGHDHGGGSGHH